MADILGWPAKPYKGKPVAHPRFVLKITLSQKIFSFLLVSLFLLSGVFVGSLAVSAQSVPRQISLTPIVTSPSDVPTAAPLSASYSSRSFMPMYVPNSNPECCNFKPFSPSLMQSFYNSTTLLSDGITGKGVTIAIVDAFGDPNIQSELHTFDQTFGLPDPPSFHVMCIDGPCNYTLGIEEGWTPEIAIDVEWAHSMAPGANINLYIGSSDLFNALFDADLAAVEGASGTGPSGSGLGTPGVYHNNIISNSWGEPENDFTASASCIIIGPPPCAEGYPWGDQVYQEAAAEGISVFVSTGDGGAFYQGDGLYQTLPSGGVDVPATVPFATAVGGTSAYAATTSGSLGFAFLGSAPVGPFNLTGDTTVKGSYGYETSWSFLNDNAQRPGYSGGTGGGYSTLFGQPAYQTGPGLPNNGVRATPDVAWDADPHTGVIIYGNDGGVIGYYEFGGTSLGAPSWAGVTALLDQATGRSLGLLNPLLYSILNKPAEYAKAFHQITYGNNNGYSAAPGCNPTTGMGTPNIGELADVLSSMHPLSVSVTNNLQGPITPETPTPAYAYDQTITLSASINGGVKVSGPVSANITSQSGTLLATNIPMKWDSVTQTYVGSYKIKSSDPAGEWSANVLANNGKASGSGYNTFEVGGGINIDSPYYSGVPESNLFEVGQVIPLAISVQSPLGTTLVDTGHYKATFYLNRLGGAIQGSVPLTYNATAELWEGNFTIPNTVHQGSWVVAFTGTDADGNRAVLSYSWIIVGIFIWPYTDSYFYVHGQKMEIFALSSSTTGTMRGTLSYDGTVIKSVAMQYNATTGVWGGTLTLPASGPGGYYTVTTRGNDGMGDNGSNSEVVSIQSSLNVALSLSKKVISSTTGKETFSVTVSNGAAPVTVGTVMARINYTYPNGTSALTVRIALVYNAEQKAWIGELNTAQVTGLASGKYTVLITAFDPFLDYGQATGKFSIS